MNCTECELPQCTLDTVNRCVLEQTRSDYHKDYYKNNKDKIKKKAKDRYRTKTDKKYLDILIDIIGGM